MNKEEIKKKGKGMIIKYGIIICLCITLLVLVTAVSLAYFTKVEIYNAYMGASVDGLFEKLTSDALTTYQTDVLGVTPNSGAEWGTEENPYIISETKHLNNLSMLQNIGYFEKYYISTNYNEDGSYKGAGADSMPYFLVCNTDGTAVCITGGKAIEPIGTEKYPFIGSVKGAFVSGMVEVDDDDGLYSDVSTIHDVQIVSNESSVDIGLFGHITCLGDPESATTDPTTGEKTFAGVVSEVSNLLLYDVTVKVDSSLWSSWLATVDHVFSYIINGDRQDGVPHETHHIGILAGHVTYSRIEYISVYYSDPAVSAIDLEHVANNESKVVDVTYLANYMSSTGFIGYLDGMNPLVDDDGNIRPDTGSGNSNLIFGAGEGGGGLMSGNYTGYVVAQRVLETYRYAENGGTPPVVIWPDAYKDETNNNDQPIETPVYINALYRKVEKDENGVALEVPKYEALCVNVSEEGETEKYYFRDGVFTFALSQANTDTIQPTWWKLDDNGKPLEVFQVGVNDASAWEAINALPPDSVLAYVRQLTSSTELESAIEAGKEVLILNETQLATLQANLYIMSLFNTSTGDENSESLNTKYYTQGVAKQFATNEQLQTYIEAYQNNLWSLPSMKNDDLFAAPATIDQLVAALDPSTGSLKAIFLGDTSTTTTADTIQKQFAITVEKAGTYSYSENDTGLPVQLNNAGQAIEYFYYENAKYPDDNGTAVEGFFYCDYESYSDNITGWSGSDGYTYYWQPLDGSAAVQINSITEDNNGDGTPTTHTLGSRINTPLATFFGYTATARAASDAHPVALRTATITTASGTMTVTGALLHRSREGTGWSWNGADWGPYSTFTLYNSTSATNVVIESEGTSFKIKMDTPLNAWIYDASAKKWYWFASSASSATELTSAPTLTPVTTGTTTTPGSGLPYYSDGTNIGIVVNKYPTYTFCRPNAASGDTNYLRLLTLIYKTNLLGGTTTFYPLWVGSDEQSDGDGTGDADFSTTLWGSSVSPTIDDNEKTATVVFAADHSVTISYANEEANQIWYVDYSGTYTTANGQTTASNQRFGASATKPNTATEKLYIYVLEGTQTGEGRTAEEEKRMNIVPKEGTSQKEYNPADYILWAESANDTDARFENGIPVNAYTVTSLSSLGWRDGEGYALGDGSASAKSALYKKFCVTEGIDFGFQLNLGNWFNYNTSGLISAPVGTWGQVANIPQGCVAYRKNTSGTEQTINVIVAVPVTDTYIGENGTVNTAVERYFCMWMAEESGSSLLQFFNPNSTEDRFALPHSNPYSVEETSKNNWDSNSALNYIKVKADVDGNGTVDDATYRCYLNGDRVLIAYSFTVSDEGVYILGAMGRDEKGETVSVPMEIVYFSAPGAASAGNDGAPNSQLGTIDFVYSGANNQVLTVKDVTSKPADLTAAYYPSYSFFYFDTRLSKGTDFITINKAALTVRRTAAATAATITWTPYMDNTLFTSYGKYIKFNQYVQGEIINEIPASSP